ncbi:MAG TPA: signal peptidase I [Gemmatimonadales bacterium]|nr:signal peptidase I [Gemmatimonadales bacterium]
MRRAASGDAAGFRLLRLALVGVGVALTVRWVAGGARLPALYYMTGPSMEPAVSAGALFLALPPKRSPVRGDLVLVELMLDDSTYHVLRRVVGLPGDTLEMRQGRLTVNRAAAPWPFRILEPKADRALDGPVEGTIYTWGPVVVEPGALFVLSDTRDMIGWPDSRFLGPLPAGRVVGQLGLVLWGGRVPPFRLPTAPAPPPAR